MRITMKIFKAQFVQEAILPIMILMTLSLVPGGCILKDNQEVHTKTMVYDMDPIIVNLADKEAPKYLKVKLNIETYEQKPNREYPRRLPQLRDAILTVLSSKTSGEILNAEGKKRLKEEIVTHLNLKFSFNLTFRSKRLDFRKLSFHMKFLATFRR